MHGFTLSHSLNRYGADLKWVKIFMFVMLLRSIKFPIMHRIASHAKFYDELRFREALNKFEF